MIFGIASGKEMNEKFERVRLSLNALTDEIGKLKERIESDALKIATLEGLVISQNNRVIIQEPVKKKTPETFEDKIVKKIRNNKGSIITSEILKLIDNYSTQEMFNIIVNEKGLCSKASFYRYLKGIRAEGTNKNVNEVIINSEDKYN